jgi:hypothetical protein
MKIAGIIFGIIVVAIIAWIIWDGNKGWQEENEVDPTKMPTKDDMERADKNKMPTKDDMERADKNKRR